MSGCPPGRHKPYAAPEAARSTCIGGGWSRGGGAGIGGGGSSTGGGRSGSRGGGGGLPGGFGLPGCCASLPGKKPALRGSVDMKQQKKDDDGQWNPEKPQKDRHELYSCSIASFENKRRTGDIPDGCSVSGKEL
jgi:hypothetical protein